MSWHTSQLSYAFGLGGLMSFYGIVSLIVYMLPSSSVGSTYKIVIIALVLLTLPFALLFGYVGSRRKKKKAAAEAAAAESSSPAQEQTPAAATAKTTTSVGSYSELDRGLDELVQFLKSSNLGEGGKEAVYSLPWYIIAGTPRSGKSSLIVGADLDLQTLPSQRPSELKFVRPTANVDWRVTSDAVFIDTAGRYQTEGVDADEWNALLEGIKKRRPQRPLDGFILVIDGDKTIKADERENDEVAKVLRSRLDEAMQRLKVTFPVYVVFTHADGIEGCRDSFSLSKNEGRSLVWGATIPLDKSANAPAEFDPEYELLQNSVMKRRITRLSAPFPPVRQLRIFNFPLHFGAARRKFGALISTLFRPNPFSESPFLRGFYFTASPAAKSSPNAPTTVAEPYFSHRLVRDVILRDKDLVRTQLAQRQKAPIFGWILTLLGAAVVISLLALSGLSLYNNKKLLDDARDRGEKLLTITKTDAYKDPAKADERSIRAEINATDQLRELLVKLDDYERHGAPWFMRMGLYSGNRVYKQYLLKTYMSVVENRYKTATIKKVEADLKKFAASNPVANPSKLTDAEEQVLSDNYDLLKAYLMLTGQYKDKADSTHIATVLEKYWTTESKIPADLKLTAQQQLEFWAKQVDRDDADYSFPRILADAKLVDDTRKKLQDFPAVYRYYKRKVTEISKEIDDKVGITTVESILTRNGSDSSLMSGSVRVKGAYTKPGYLLMKTAISEADAKLSEDDWVMGEIGKKQVAQTTDSAKLEDRYYRDYADTWRTFVKGVTVKPYDVKNAAPALQTMASQVSPMKILLIEISKNTNLSAKPDVQGWWDWIKSWFVSAQNSDTGGSSQPEKEFRPLFTFVGKKDDKENAPVEKYCAILNTVFNKLNGRSPDDIKAIAAALANDDDKLKLRDAETSVSNLVQSFNETPSSQELALLIQQPLANLRSLLGQGSQDQIKKAWTDEMLPAAKEIEKGFPFEDGQAESDLTKLTAFLNPVDGKLSKFYDDKLKKYFEESNGQLKVKDTSDVKFSDDFVAYLNNAFALRKALFGTSPTPKFDYAFVLKAGKDTLVEITIDGQKVTPEGTASINGTFPAAQSAETGVIMTAGAGGPSPSAPAPAANTNSAAPSKTAATGDTSNLKFPGTWGLFRFVEAGKPQKQATGEYALSYSVGGKSVGATIKPNGGDLFDKTIFRQLKAPATLLK
ncbi:MAG: type VI secretion system membrane subunit TssM [Acidobacteriota bacterium]